MATEHGPGRCVACGQFAGDGHTCPLSFHLTEAAHGLYGALGAGSGELRTATKQAAAKVGDAGSAPASTDDVEDVLTGLRRSSDQAVSDGRLSPEQSREVGQRLETSWAALRDGGTLRVREVAALRQLQSTFGHATDPSDRVASAARAMRTSQVEVGIQALRSGRTGDSQGYQSALARREEARRELLRAQANFDGAVDAQDRCPACGQFTGTGHRCPVPEGLPAADYSQSRGETRTHEMLADLQTAVQAVVQSGQLQRWIDAMASNGLQRWSLNNRLLAVMQLAQRGEDLDKVHLMGFRQWENLDRRVRKGEKAVWILAPMTRKIRDTDDDGSTSDKTIVTGFKAVPVFNISQTDGTPLPDAPIRPVHGEATPGTLEGLRERVAGAGYAYEETAIPGCRPDTGEGTLGYTDPQSKRIVVDERLSPAQKASTIAHELGHVHCGHVDGDFEDYCRHRGRMETEAEMTAYMVSRARGQDRSGADAFSPGYIATWSRGDTAVMTTAMDKATKAFNTIMAGAWPASN